MFCPRCGSPNTDTTKFCRQCGLSLAQLADYVASGGTAPLSPGNLPNLAQPVTQSLEGMTPRQKMALTIVGMTLLIPLFGVIGGALFGNGDIAGIPAYSCPSASSGPSSIFAIRRGGWHKSNGSGKCS